MLDAAAAAASEPTPHYTAARGRVNIPQKSDVRAT